MLKMAEALAELGECYAGLRGPDFFKGSVICEFVLNIDKASYSKKLNGHRKFVPRELNALARYFELGENGMDLFQLGSASQFREQLKKRGIGCYATSPALRLNSTLWEMSHRSDARLDFHRLAESPVTRNGFEILPTTEPDHSICLSKGSTTQFKFNYPANQDAARWFMLLNFHIETEIVHVLNPTHDEDRLPLHGSPCIFPSGAQVKIYRDNHLGHHRLYGLALDTPQLSVVVGELARLRYLHHGHRSAEEIAVNTGQLTLDQDAAGRIQRALTDGNFECASLDYIQV